MSVSSISDSNLDNSCLNQVIKDSLDLINWFSGYSKYSQVYKLDRSWISISIIDSLLKKYRTIYSLSASYNLTDEDNLFIRKNISHFTLILCQILKELEINHNIYYDEESLICISIEDLEEIIFNIERDIFDIIRSNPTKIEVSKDQAIQISKSSNFLVPYITKILNTINSKKSLEIDKVISRQVASWNEEVYPNCHLSHVPEIYLNKVIYPHFLLSDNLPFEDSSSFVISYLRDIGLKIGVNFDSSNPQAKSRVPRQLSSLLRAWCQSPDEQLSILSLCLSSVFSGLEDYPEEILSSVRSKSYSSPLVREAYYKISQNIRQVNDWSGDSSKQSDYEIDREIGREKVLGFLPWISLSNKYLIRNYHKNNKLKLFFEKLKIFSMKEAEEVLSSMLEEDPGDIELRIQSIKFMHLRGELELAHSSCKILLSEPNIDSNPYFYNIWGLILIDMNKPELSLRYFKSSLAMNNCIGLFRADVLNNSGYSLVLQDRLDEAKEDLSKSLELNPNKIATILNTALCLARQNDDSYKDYLLRAIKLAPFDPRVFSNLENL